MFYILSIGFSACLRPVGARALVTLISLAGGRPNSAWATGPACSWGPCVPASPPPPGRSWRGSGPSSTSC